MERIVPISEKCLLTLDEAVQYTGLGHQKLRDISNEDNCNFVLWNGSKRMLKRASDFNKKLIREKCNLPDYAKWMMDMFNF